MSVIASGRTASDLDLEDAVFADLSYTPRAVLRAHDGNSDHKIQFTEVEDAAVPMPGGRGVLKVRTAGDWDTYRALWYSRVQTEALAGRFRGSVTAAVDAESWLAGRQTSIYAHGPLQTLAGTVENDTKLLDLRSEAAGLYLLLERRVSEKVLPFYMTVRLPALSGPAQGYAAGIVWEVAGRAVPLWPGEQGEEFRKLRLELLTRLFGLLARPLPSRLDDAQRLAHLDRLEALIYREQLVDAEAADGKAESAGEREKIISLPFLHRDRQGHIVENEGRAIRAEVFTEASPFGFEYEREAGDNAYHRFPVRSTELLTGEEIQALTRVLDRLPEGLLTALQRNGILKDLKFQIVTADEMQALAGEANAGMYFGYHKMVLLRRDFLSAATDTLTDLLIHELAHGVFPNRLDGSYPSAEYALRLVAMNFFHDGPLVQPNMTESYRRFFLNEYYEEIKRRASLSPVFPSVTIYSLRSIAEFFAEATEAYFQGETDNNPSQFILSGPRSRAELREKLPEFYLALTLFYDRKSDFQGDLKVFSWEAKVAIDAMLASPLAPILLAPGTDPALISQCYSDQRQYQSSVEPYGQFVSAAVLDGSQELGGGVTSAQFSFLSSQQDYHALISGKKIYNGGSTLAGIGGDFDRDIAFLAERAYVDANPVRLQLSAQTGEGEFHFPVRSADPLSDSVYFQFVRAFRTVPQELLDVLEKNGTLDQLNFEIIDARVMGKLASFKVNAFYNPAQKKIYIKSSAIEYLTPEQLMRMIRHELAHAIFPCDVDSLAGFDLRQLFRYIYYENLFNDGLSSAPDTPESSTSYFLNDYFENIRRRIEVGPYTGELPALNLYSLFQLSEFFAEAVEAFFVGEVDLEHTADPFSGSTSRSELRAKYPELYIALAVFFRQGYPYFGDLDVFSKESKAAIDALLASPLAPILLAPGTDPALISQCYYDERQLISTAS